MNKGFNKCCWYGIYGIYGIYGCFYGVFLWFLCAVPHLCSARHGAVAPVAAQRTPSAASSSAGSEKHSWVLKELKEPMGTPSVFHLFCWIPLVSNIFFKNVLYNI